MSRLTMGVWAVVLGAVLAGCGDDGGGGTDAGTDGSGALVITITSPTNNATGVSVSKPVLRATFSRALANPEELKLVLIKDGTSYYGLKDYSATELRVTFQPFNLLQSNASYTFKVSAEGAEASAAFTTEKANAGTLPSIADKTYDFRLKEITYPKDLAQVFNSQLQSAPPVLMHVVQVKDLGSSNGINKGSFLIAGSTGKAGDPYGQSKVLAEDATHTTTTSMAISGNMEGTWFGAGPSDLHLTASGIPLVIRDFYATGLFSSDGTQMSSVRLTGVIDPKELGKALGGIDLSFICTDARFKKYCDKDGRLRVAAEVQTWPNPIGFTTFITTPVNNSVSADPTTKIQAYFSGAVDETKTTVKLTEGTATTVTGTTSFASKSLTFTPGAALKAGTKYNVELAGVGTAASASDTRHLTFTTK